MIFKYLPAAVNEKNPEAIEKWEWLNILLEWDLVM